jgi:hypothetical protein
MTLFLIILHLAGAVGVTVARKRGIMHFSSAMLPAVVLLPLWGPVYAIAAELHIRGGEKADVEPDYGRFDILDQVYRSIRMDKEDMSNVLPIEDVLESGAPVQRRSLLLSVLHEGPESFVRPLRLAGVNDDTEVVHYAVTALVELRSEFTQRISRMEKLYQQHPNSPKVIEDFADLDQEYLESGIPDSSERMERLAHCRSMLDKLLNYIAWQETGSSKMTSSAGEVGKTGYYQAQSRKVRLLKRLGNICLLQNDARGAEEAGQRLLKERPESEDGYMLILRARAAVHDDKGIADLISTVRNSGIYLSPAAREQLAFWSA